MFVHHIHKQRAKPHVQLRDAKVFAGEVGQQQKLLPIIFKRLTQDK
jgi:hypothetical protein